MIITLLWCATIWGGRKCPSEPGMGVPGLVRASECPVGWDTARSAAATASCGLATHIASAELLKKSRAASCACAHLFDDRGNWYLQPFQSSAVKYSYPEMCLGVVFSPLSTSSRAARKNQSLDLFSGYLLRCYPARPGLGHSLTHFNIPLVSPPMTRDGKRSSRATPP